MSEPAPELDAEDALRGIVNQLTIHGQRMPVIIPGSVIAALDDFAALLQAAQAAGYLLDLLPRAMPWARGFSQADLEALAANLIDAASSGDHAPERLAAVLREWRETAEILSDPNAVRQIADGRAEIERGDVVSGEEIVHTLGSRST